MFGLFLFLTYYLQIVKGYSPVKTGFAFLPMIAGMIIGLDPDRRPPDDPGPAAPADGPRASWSPRLGMLMLTQLEIDTSYAGADPAGAAAARPRHGYGVHAGHVPGHARCRTRADAGVASAMVNTSQQVGGAIGTALLNTIAASATTAYIDRPRRRGRGRPGSSWSSCRAMVHGYTSAIWWAVGILVAAAAIAFTLINTGQSGRRSARSPPGDGAEDEVKVPVIAH